MRKLVIAAALLATLAGGAFAVNAVAAPGEGHMGMHGMADFGFMLDARLAGMKSALKLTADQEKNWAPFETAVRDAAKLRAEMLRAHHDAMEKDIRPTPIEHMTEMSDHLAKASVELKKVADSAKPLFDSLDETQKRHFGPLLMSLRAPHGGPGGGWHMPWGHHEREHGEPL